MAAVSLTFLSGIAQGLSLRPFVNLGPFIQSSFIEVGPMIKTKPPYQYE